MNPKALRSAAAIPLVAALALPAWADDTAPAGGEAGGEAKVTATQTTQQTTQTQTVYGPLPPPGWDPNGHLPSSSRAVSDINVNTDTFDLNLPPPGPASVHGGPNATFVLEGGAIGGGTVPEGHTVRRGDTLWDLSGRYYANPYQWPRLWGLNPQIQNPHWIYPGDLLRLREAGGAHIPIRGGRRGNLVPGTVFLRDIGWVDDRKEDTWGELVGAPEDTMLLAAGNDVYIQLEANHPIAIGEQLTIFRPIRTVESENAKGSLVSIRGTARVERFNPNTHMVRAKIIESLDVIERGAKVGPVTRKFDIVPPVRSEVDLNATILGAVYAYQFYGQNQVVFIDRGEKEGVKIGQRFFAVRRGDRWDDNIDTAGQLAVLRPRVEDDRPDRVDRMFTDVNEEKLPDETYAELRIVRMREHTATALVVASRYEIERNARLVSRKGL